MELMYSSRLSLTKFFTPELIDPVFLREDTYAASKRSYRETDVL